jgi:KDO2-lipid IV(A) lauroyltransferase
MAKPRNATVDFAVYLAVRVAVALLQALPRPAAYGLGHGLAWLAHRVDRRHREVARENLSLAFPEKSPRQIDRLVRDCYRHCVRMIVEIALLPRRMAVDNYRVWIDSVRLGDVVKPLIERRPLLIVTAHFGNWELAGFALGALGFRTYAIARVLDNPHLERYLKEFRQKTGQTIIAKKDDFDRLADVLQAGGKVATLGDQDAGPRGVFVNFFGRPASAHKAVALMAIQFDAVMVVTGIPRVGEPFGESRYSIDCDDVIDPRDYATRGDAVKAITQRYHDSLERMIRKHPEQYFWLHRRWKSQPTPKKKPAATAAET